MKRLCISFSGGKTSALMTRLLLSDSADEYDDIAIVFANTGQENEETLEFVDKCDRYFGLNVVWLEAKVNPENRKGTSHSIVSFETADREGRVFQEVIKKYGIPNNQSPFCTRELKLHPIRSYLRSIGWKKGSYDTAIGIRSDEMDRISSKMVEERLIYPLAEKYKLTKSDVNSFWATQPFTLRLPEHRGNCKWCWKKSFRKLYTLAQESPEVFDFPARMERDYSLAGNHSAGTHRYFFRGGKSTNSILAESLVVHFEPFIDEHFNSLDTFDPVLDSANGCSESCEVF